MNETEMEIQVRSCKTHDVRDINRNVEHLFLEQGAEGNLWQKREI